MKTGRLPIGALALTAVIAACSGGGPGSADAGDAARGDAIEAASDRLDQTTDRGAEANVADAAAGPDDGAASDAPTGDAADAQADLPAADAPGDVTAADAPADLPAADAPGDVPAADAPADLPGPDAPADLPGPDAPPDLPTADGAVDVSGPDALPDAVDDRPGAPLDAGGAADAGSPPDASTADAASDSGAAIDAPIATVYSSLTDTAKWTEFGILAVANDPTRFSGGTFDGRYVYFAPIASYTGQEDSLFVRYDTRSSFSAAAAWQTLSTHDVGVESITFYGSVFDGRYVYYIPVDDHRDTGTVVPGTQLTRYDTHGAFTDPASWRRRTTTASAFIGGVFDGRYLYLVPALNGVVERIDTQAEFASAGASTTFALAPLDAPNHRYRGGVFDGRYVYLVPYGYTSGLAGDPKIPGAVVRYDVQAPFTAAASWSTFKLADLDAMAFGYMGGVFDGRYIHLVPSTIDALNRSVAIRYDTQGAFGAVASWSKFTVSSLDTQPGGFHYGAFDGRHVYFVPFVSGGKIVRYDTQASYTTASSWTSFPLQTVAPHYSTLEGAVFDGQFLYLVCHGHGAGRGAWIPRFDAKTPPALPALPAHFGSFY